MFLDGKILLHLFHSFNDEFSCSFCYYNWETLQQKNLANFWKQINSPTVHWPGTFVQWKSFTEICGEITSSCSNKQTRVNVWRMNISDSFYGIRSLMLVNDQSWKVLRILCLKLDGKLWEFPPIQINSMLFQSLVQYWSRLEIEKKCINCSSFFIWFSVQSKNWSGCWKEQQIFTRKEEKNW